MTQRNPMNDRNLADKTGQTRKSAASAKPKSTRAATLRDPAPKTAKQKKAEAKAREEQRHKRSMVLDVRFEDTPRYKHLRHYWWGFLITAIACTAISAVISTQTGALFQENPDALYLGFMPQSVANALSIVLMVAAYGFIIAAFVVDLSKVRKARNEFEQLVVNSNSKEMRRSQKKHRAELREQERAKREAEANAQTAPQEEKPKGIRGLFARKSKKAEKDAIDNAVAETASTADETTASNNSDASSGSADKKQAK